MHITYIYSVIIQNKGYAPGLALGRRSVNSVSPWWLRDLLLHGDLLLILFNHLFVLLLALGHKPYQLAFYIHAMMMQRSILRQQQFLK